MEHCRSTPGCTDPIGLSAVINPRRACAAMVTVLGSVCPSVSTKLTSRTRNRAINECAHSVACERQNLCGDLPETTAFKRYYVAKHERKSQYANYSGLPVVSFLRSTHSEAPESYPVIVNDIQLCPKRCLLMLLARDGARTDNTTSTATNPRRGQFPRMRIGVVPKMMRRGFAL